MAYPLPIPQRYSPQQVVLSVELEARNGRRWRAIGGGSTVDEAIGFARGSAPDGHDWRVVRIDDLYGD
jgi:hypothetical protein